MSNGNVYCKVFRAWVRSPSTTQHTKKMKRDCKIIKDNTMNVFKDQLYEYLKSYTPGDTNNGDIWRAWKRFWKLATNAWPRRQHQRKTSEGRKVCHLSSQAVDGGELGEGHRRVGETAACLHYCSGHWTPWVHKIRWCVCKISFNRRFRSFWQTSIY